MTVGALRPLGTKYLIGLFRIREWGRLEKGHTLECYASILHWIETTDNYYRSSDPSGS